MIIIRRLNPLFIIALGILVPGLGLGAVDTVKQPIDVIHEVGDRILSILTTCPPNMTPEIKRKRRQEVVKIVYDFVDFEEMAKRALGRYWKIEPEDKRKEFVSLFEKLLYNTYVNRIDAYSCKKEKIFYDEQKIRGRYAIVRTRVRGDKNAEFPVEYRLKLKDGTWKCYDVVIEGVSFISNYRTQFNSILARKSFDELLDDMRRKISEIEQKHNQQ